MVTTRSSRRTGAKIEEPAKAPGKRAAAKPAGPKAKKGKIHEKEENEKHVGGQDKGTEDLSRNKQNGSPGNGTTEEKPKLGNENAKDTGGKDEKTDEEESEKNASNETHENAEVKKEENEQLAAAENGIENDTKTKIAVNGEKETEKNAFDEVKDDTEKVKKEAANEEAEKEKLIANADSIVENKEIGDKMPPSILEKGIIYFFFRGRVSVEDVESMKDVARTFIVLRPIPLTATLGDGPLEDLNNSRLIDLPKKTLPKRPRDRFLAFVEKAGVSIKDLKETFIPGEHYETKTRGYSSILIVWSLGDADTTSDRTIPSVTPVAEGVYAITTTGSGSGQTSHLAYHITVPDVLGHVQESIGLCKAGSFIMNVKNPREPVGVSGINPGLKVQAQYPEEMLDKMRELRWVPLAPEMLDYPNAQILMIGGSQGEMSKAMQEADVDKEEGKQEPGSQLEDLENVVCAHDAML
jgi:hypothetical protein